MSTIDRNFKNTGKSTKEDEVYEVRWHGRGRILMSRSYCRDRSSVQQYIDATLKKLAKINAFHVQINGNSPDYFETIDKNDYDSGISIRKVDKPQIPFNVIADKFEDLRLLYCSKFIGMLDDNNLKFFAKQKEDDIESGNALYSML